LGLGRLRLATHIHWVCRCDFIDRCTHYVPSRAQRLQTAPLALVEPNAPLSEAKKRAITAVVGAFSHEVLMSLCQVLMTQYFVLTNEDNEQWAETPEEYAFEEVSRHPRRHLHPPHVSSQSISGSPALPMRCHLGLFVGGRCVEVLDASVRRAPLREAPDAVPGRARKVSA